MRALAARVSARFMGAPPVFRSLFWFLCAGTSFLAMMSCARALSGEIHVLEIVFWRALLGMGFMLPWLIRHGRERMRSRKIPLHGLRTAINYAGLTCTFYAVTMLPLADITAITFVRPVIATLLAILILGEVSRGRRWAAIAFGLCGALIIIRPGFQTFNPGVFLVFGMVLSGAAIAIIARYLVQHDTPDTMAMYMMGFLTVMSFVPALTVWTMPNLEQFGILAAIGLFGTYSQRALGRAFQSADASVVVSFDYLRLPIAAAFGFVFFAEIPDIWVWAGAAVICASSILLARAEAR